VEKSEKKKRRCSRKIVRIGTRGYKFKNTGEKKGNGEVVLIYRPIWGGGSRGEKSKRNELWKKARSLNDGFSMTKEGEVKRKRSNPSGGLRGSVGNNKTKPNGKNGSWVNGPAGEEETLGGKDSGKNKKKGKNELRKTGKEGGEGTGNRSLAKYIIVRRQVREKVRANDSAVGREKRRIGKGKETATGGGRW